MNKKEMNQLVRTVRDAGCSVSYTRGNHLRVVAPKGIVILATTPSDRKSVVNMRATLRRYGVQLL